MKEVKPLMITEGVQNFLWSVYDPKSEKPKGAFLLAGKGDDGFWYSNTAISGEILFNVLLDTQKYGTLIKHIQENTDKFKLIPWFQYKEKQFTKKLEDFIEKNILTKFNDLIILKPVNEPNKKHFEVLYLKKENDRFNESFIEPTEVEKVNKTAQKNITDLMDYWIDTLV